MFSWIVHWIGGKESLSTPDQVISDDTVDTNPNSFTPSK